MWIEHHDAAVELPSYEKIYYCAFQICESELCTS